MIDVNQRMKDILFEYSNSKTNQDLKHELTDFSRNLGAVSNDSIDFISIDERIHLLMNKLTENTFTNNLLRAITIYGNENVDFYFNQKYETVCSGISNGEILFEMSIDKDQNLVLNSVSIKEPINSRHTVSDFLVFADINNLFLYNPTMFLNTILGRIYTGDVLLRYTDDLILTMKVKITINPKSLSAQRGNNGHILKAKYHDGVLCIERNIDLEESRDSTLNLKVYDSNFDWLEISY